MGWAAATSVFSDLDEVGATDLAGPGLYMAFFAGLVGAIAGFRRVKSPASSRRGSASSMAVTQKTVAEKVAELRTSSVDQGWDFEIVSESAELAVYRTRRGAGSAWRKVSVRRLEDGRTEVKEGG